MFVACSTLCFGKHSLEHSLRIMEEMRFSKVDLAIHEDSNHLKPSEVCADVNRTAQHLRALSTLGISAIHLKFGPVDEAEMLRQFRSICRLSRLLAIPIICIPAPAATDEPVQSVERLRHWAQVADAEGVILTVETQIGTITEMPEAAMELCEKVPNLGLTLDPSHYLVGPARGLSFDDVYPYVRHVRLRDTGAGMHEFQVRVGQGQVDYGRIIGLLERESYDRTLTVDIRDIPDAAFAMEPEVRKLKYLLESLV